MKFLQEILMEIDRFNRFERDDQEDLPDDEEDLPPDDEFGDEDLPDEEGEDLEDLPDDEFGDEDLPDDEFGDEDLPDEEGENDDAELDQVANKATQDPDRMGLIRTVKGAHLVYKRETEDGTYEELWFYNSGDSMKDELKVRRAIISGTDIPPTKTSSPDGKQTYTVWATGNAEMLNIKGLPS